MAFWYRVKQSQLRSLSNQFKIQIHGAYSPNHTTSRTRIWDFGKLDSFIHNSQFELCNNVRFFAAPVQPKQEEKDSDGPRLNEKITAQYIRLVTDEGHNVVPRQEALERARRLKLDLVEVQRNAKPPVCKLMDYHREKYKQQLKEKDRSKSKSEVALRKGDCKEVRVEGKIEQKDLQMKADQVKRLMDSGYRVKCIAKSNEKKAMANEDQNLGGLLARFYALIEDVSIVESGPRVEKKMAYVIVRHVKFGPSKKGSKKASIVEDTSSQVGKVSISAAAINPVNESPVLDSTTPESYPTEAPLGTENRYKKEPRNRFPPSKETYIAGPDLRRLQAQFPNQVRQPQQFPNQSRQPQQYPNQGRQPQQYPNQGRQPQQYPNQGRQPQQYPNQGRQPQQYPNQGRQPQQYPNQGRQPLQYPNQGRQLQFDSSTSPSSIETNHVQTGASILGNLKLPADEFPSQEHARPGASSAPNSPGHNRYGMFNTPKVDSSPEAQGVPAELNRYKKAANPNSSVSNSHGSRRPDFDNGGQGR